MTREQMIDRLYNALTDQARARTSRENIGDVLDAMAPAWLNVREEV